jgi:dihydrofolate synthase/folylpolyglutamate synthase
MDYAEARDWLFGRRRMGMKYGLERISSLVSDLGSPHLGFRTVHVVGTNGKGSTTAMLAETARHLGYRAGRMTSPHLLDFRERIAVDGAWIPEDAVLRFVREFRDRIERREATFFEIVTALAAWHFGLEGTDWVIAEAGLGGRYDASRVLAGEATVFTGVQIEHSRILGSTRPLIAVEKLAIAEPGTLLVAAQQSPDVEEIIATAVAERSLRRIRPVAADRGGLPGEHQVRNASLALTAALELFDDEPGRIRRAFEMALDTVRWPGRLDLRRGDPPILFDVAHNPEAVEQLLKHISGWEKPVPAVVGILSDKPWKEMAALLAPHVGPLVTTTPMSERKLDAADLAAEFRQVGLECLDRERIEDALELCRSMAGGRTVLVTGSFFVVGEAMLTAWRRGWIEGPTGEDSQAIPVDSESAWSV